METMQESLATLNASLTSWVGKPVTHTSELDGDLTLNIQIHPGVEWEFIVPSDQQGTCYPGRLVPDWKNYLNKEVRNRYRAWQSTGKQCLEVFQYGMYSFDLAAVTPFKTNNPSVPVASKPALSPLQAYCQKYGQQYTPQAAQEQRDHQVDQLSPAYLARCLATLTPLSLATETHAIFAEWQYLGDCRFSAETEECQLCGKRHIHNVFTITNPLTSKELEVGSDCVELVGIEGRVAGLSILPRDLKRILAFQIRMLK